YRLQKCVDLFGKDKKYSISHHITVLTTVVHVKNKCLRHQLVGEFSVGFAY
ncbi:MAG: hypothetical protein ACI90V_008043, partial [Bacillariaceae sp.]